MVPSESSQLTSTAAQAEATTTATGGDGDKKEEEIMPPSYTPASAPELALVPVFEEPKGPRPTASVPVPGTNTCYMYMYSALATRRCAEYA